MYSVFCSIISNSVTDSSITQKMFDIFFRKGELYTHIVLAWWWQRSRAMILEGTICWRFCQNPVFYKKDFQILKTGGKHITFCLGFVIKLFVLIIIKIHTCESGKCGMSVDILEKTTGVVNRKIHKPYPAQTTYNVTPKCIKYTWAFQILSSVIPVRLIEFYHVRHCLVQCT